MALGNSSFEDAFNGQVDSYSTEQMKAIVCDALNPATSKNPCTASAFVRKTLASLSAPTKVIAQVFDDTGYLKCAGTPTFDVAKKTDALPQLAKPKAKGGASGGGGNEDDKSTTTSSPTSTTFSLLPPAAAVAAAMLLRQ
ncbi:hypothetical protein PRIPAC_93393 [Pristionchus pacificus]|uniref:Uncharacterized protein n=1 Tax=Pristionchus pacificus TaxID=54126 RepID=A0A2A6BQK7_PRIPA|nr:hypothetical protein PRIPAC_93393 [Pristionchus pacificus]|eukprot:PDM68116.1 hypothetical protein PRIPAC_46160 [Pristionchus pacificus]